MVYAIALSQISASINRYFNLVQLHKKNKQKFADTFSYPECHRLGLDEYNKQTSRLVQTYCGASWPRRRSRPDGTHLKTVSLMPRLLLQPKIALLTQTRKHGTTRFAVIMPGVCETGSRGCGDRRLR